MAATLKANLKAAFAGESQANWRYLYFAQKADVEGHSDVAVVFRSTAEGETGHAHGHLAFLEAVGDPATGLPIGDTEKNLATPVAVETHEYADIIAEWPVGPVKRGSRKLQIGSRPLPAERSHAGRFQKTLNELK
jgi:rubrerythrin